MTLAAPSTLPAPFTGLAGDRVVEVSTVATNDAGDGPRSGAATTVLPFATLPAFICRQFDDLTGRCPPSSPTALDDAQTRLLATLGRKAW